MAGFSGAYMSVLAQEKIEKNKGLMAFIVFLTPLIFMLEKEVVPNAPLFLAQHLYFYFSIVCAALVLIGKPHSGKVSIFFVASILACLFNFISLLLYGEMIESTSLLVSTVNLSYFLFVMWFFKCLFQGGTYFKAYLKGLELSFHVILFVCFFQLLAISGFGWAEGINNALAPIYEARWVPYKIMGSLHYYYTNGSYATTMLRMNGLSKEASTFSIGIALFFVPFFMPLATREIPGINRKKYLIYTILISAILASAQSSTGIALSGTVIALIVYYGKKSFLRNLFLSLICFFVLMLVYIYAQDAEYISKLSDLSNVSTQTRYGTIVAGLRSILDFPFLGRGMAFYTNLFDYVPSWGLSQEITLYADRDALRVFFLPIAIYGEYGLIIFIIVVAYFFNLLKFSLNKGDQPPTAEQQSALCIFLLMIVACTSTSSYLHPFYFSALGVSYAVWKNNGNFFPRNSVTPS